MLEGPALPGKLFTMRIRAAAILVLALASPAAAVRWEFVEAEVSLRPDGKATVVYKVALEPQGLNLHGFYFKGFTGTAHFDMSGCYATDSAGRRHRLSIRPVGRRKYDIVLAGGRSVRSGRVIYVFTYGTDLGASGHLAKTTSAAGAKLVVPFLLVIFGKHRGMLSAADGLKEINWLEADWTPPQIVLSSYRKEGKIADLNVIEAGVFLGISVNRILSIMLGVMARKGAVRLHDDGTVEVLDRHARLNSYEATLLDAVGPDGRLGEDAVRRLIQQIVDAAQAAGWDATSRPPGSTMPTSSARSSRRLRPTPRSKPKGPKSRSALSSRMTITTRTTSTAAITTRARSSRVSCRRRWNGA